MQMSEAPKPTKRPGPKKELDNLACIEQVKLMFEEGSRVSDIADYIQDEAKECLDISKDVLIRKLYRYLTDLIKPDAAKELVPHTVSMLKGNLNETIDPIQSLNIVLAIQVDRIMMEYAIEKKLGKTISSNTKSIQVAAYISDLINKATSDDLARRLKGASLDKPDAGDTLDQIGKIRDAYAQKYGEVAANVISNPDARRRILNIMEKIEKANSGPLYDLVYKKVSGGKSRPTPEAKKENTDNSQQPTGESQGGPE